MKKAYRFHRSTVLVASIAASMLVGCATLGNLNTFGSGTSTASIPRVQDCAVLSTGSPSRFACNGKVYTSYQLATIRENAAKKNAADQ